MIIKDIFAVFFSPVGSTEKITCGIAERIGNKLNVEVKTMDFTLPSARDRQHRFQASDLVIFGVPTYAGKVPNKVLPFVQKLFQGENTPVIPVVTFGNRSYDNSLAELKYELEQNGFHTAAAAAFACRHVFSDKIAAGRPDEEDWKTLDSFAEKAVDIVSSTETGGLENLIVPVKGKHDAPYYVPKGMDGRPAKFLKAKPKTDPEKCDSCGLCIRVCPMGSVNPDNAQEVSGICIKCHACIRKCSKQAKYFDDPALLSHIAMLEHNYTRRAKPEVFYADQLQ